MRYEIVFHVYARLERPKEAETLLHELTGRDLSDWDVDEEWLVSEAGRCALRSGGAIARSGTSDFRSTALQRKRLDT